MVARALGGGQCVAQECAAGAAANPSSAPMRCSFALQPYWRVPVHFQPEELFLISVRSLTSSCADRGDPLVDLVMRRSLKAPLESGRTLASIGAARGTLAIRRVRRVAQRRDQTGTTKAGTIPDTSSLRSNRVTSVGMASAPDREAVELREFEL